MPTEEEILKQTVDQDGQHIPTELQVPVAADTPVDTRESIAKEAEDGAVTAWLAQLKDSDVPTDEKELVKFIRDNVPHLDGNDDAAVLAAWRGEKAAEEGTPTPTGEATPAEAAIKWTPQGYSVYGKDGAALSEYSEEIQNFLTDSVFGYQAMGVEQKRSLAEVVRNASMGHLNHQRYTSLEGDATKLREELTAATEKNTSLSGQFDIYDRAIMAATQGNLELLEALIEEAKSTSTTQADPRIAELEAKVAKFESAQAGDQWLTEKRPYLRELANRFGVAPTDYAKFEEFAVAAVAAAPDRQDSVLQHDLPMSLIAGGYLEGGTAPTAVNGAPAPADIPPEKIAVNEAAAKIQSLSAEIANMKNEKAASAAESGPPSSGPGGADTGSPDDTPDFTTASEGMRWLRAR